VITAQEFSRIREFLGQQGEEDLAWAEGITPIEHPVDFALEAIFVICNSGMKHTVAREIYERCCNALANGTPVLDVFGHRGKVAAIETIWRDREGLFRGYHEAPDKLAFLEALPWIGGITKFHLAKNFGLQYAKPDVHLQRLADREGCTAQQLCERLAHESGLRVATVDTLLWRACAVGIIDSRSGVIRAPVRPQEALLL
jgi:hypothetical protein